MKVLLIPLPIVALLTAMLIGNVSPHVEEPVSQSTPEIFVIPEGERFQIPSSKWSDTCVGLTMFLSLPPKCFNAEGEVVSAWSDRNIIQLSR
jgi:hypothetical protein